MTTTFCLLAAIVLGAALQLANGAIHDLAMVYLLVALAAMFAAAGSSPSIWPRVSRERAFSVTSVLGLVWAAYPAFFSSPGLYLEHPNLAVHHAFAVQVLLGGGILI